MDYIIHEEDINEIWSLWNNSKDQNYARISLKSIDRSIIPPEIERTMCNDGYLPAIAIKPKINFAEIKAGEDALKRVFDEIRAQHTEAIISGVLLLDSIYHTQTYDSLHFAFELKELLKADDFALLEKIKSASKESDESEKFTKAECIDKIASLKVKDEGRKHAYSLATKFCNWVNPEAFPIFDSYVAWLLHYYLHKGKTIDRFDFSKTSYGSYFDFLSAYNYFKGEMIENGIGFNYKQIDTYMWTIGKIIGNQSTITYIEPERKNND